MGYFLVFVKYWVMQKSHNINPVKLFIIYILFFFVCTEIYYNETSA